MTIYQAEMQRKAHQHGCDTQMDKSETNLHILYDGRHIADVDKTGYLVYPYPKGERTEPLIDKLCEDAKLVREYVGIYESAQPMKAADVARYRKFSEFGTTVFAGMYSPAHGFMFCTWSQAKHGTYVTNGHYTPDYESAKEDFATRAGLVSSDRLFDLDESEDIYRCIGYARDYCDAIDFDKDRDLMAIQDKLMDAYPQIEESPPSFEETEGQQMNL